MSTLTENHAWIWMAITSISLVLSTFVPIRIKNNRIRRFVNLVLLVPVCFVILFYVYPVGIELFKKWALSF